MGLPASASLGIADVYLALGERTKAHDLLEEYAATGLSAGHREFVVEFLRDRGFADLIPLAQC